MLRKKISEQKFIAIILSLTIIFFAKVIAGDRYFFGDNFSLELPYLNYIQNSFRNGIFPLWNNLLFSGVPLIGDINIPLFHPLILLLFIFEAVEWMTIFIVLNITITGIFAYLFLKECNKSNKASLLGAITFMFSASMMTFTNNMALVSSATFLPISFFLIQKYLNKRKIVFPLLLGLMTAFQFSSGHIQPTLYTVIIISIYLLLQKNLKANDKIKGFSVWFLAALAISAPVILSFLDFANSSTRTLFNFKVATDSSFHPLYLIRLFLPKLFSDPSIGFSWGPSWRSVLDNTAYIGILPTVLISIFLIRSKSKSFLDKFFIVTFLLSLVIAMGRYTPIYGILYEIIPMFNRLRVPVQILLLFNFAESYLFCSAFEWYSERKKSFDKKRWLCLLGGLNILILLIINKSQTFFNVIYPFIEKFLKNSQFHNRKVDYLIFSHTAECLLYFALLLLVSIIAIKNISIKRNIGFLTILSVVFLDLFFQNSMYVITANQKNLNITSAPAEFLKENLQTNRYLSLNECLPYTGLSVYWENMVFQPPFVESIYSKEESKSLNVLRQRVASLSPNWGMLYDLPTINGYGSMVLFGYSKFTKTTPRDLDVNSIDCLLPGDPRLDILGVKYIIVDKTISSFPEGLEAKYTKVLETETNEIYENKKVWPRSFLWDVDKISSGSAEIIKYTPNRVKIKAVAEKENLSLVLTDIDYKGWDVLIDGKKEKIDKFMEIFRSVKIPKGKHQIDFIFRPNIFGILN